MCLVICIFLTALPAWAGQPVPSEAPLHLTLAESLAKARTMPVEVLVAQARVDQAIARLSQARAGLLPHVEAAASGARQTRDLRSSGIQIPGASPQLGPFNTFDARGRITQIIFDPAAFERWRSARAGRKLSEAQMDKARQDALALVGTMHIQARRSQERAHMTLVLLRRDQKALNLAQVKYRQGTGSLLDLKKARADYARSRYVHRQAESEAVQTRLDIGAALQIPAATPIIFDDNDYASILGKTGDLNEQNPAPDVVAAERQLEVAQAAVAQAQAGFWPQISGMADYGRSGEGPGEASNTYTVGLQASVPIWEGGSRQADVAQARAQAKESQAVLEDTKRRNKAQTVSSREDMAQARALIQAKKAELSAANEQMAVALKRLNLGIGHQFDVYAAAAQKASIEDELQEASALLWTAKIQLAHSLGQMETLIEKK